jgi:hypothetical protein
MKHPGLYTVSGPGVDEKRGSAMIALTRAQTFALRSPVPATFYVRKDGDDALYRVERNDVGVVITHSLKEAS